jgi:hypothetical protein
MRKINYLVPWAIATGDDGAIVIALGSGTTSVTCCSIALKNDGEKCNLLFFLAYICMKYYLNFHLPRNQEVLMIFFRSYAELSSNLLSSHIQTFFYVEKYYRNCCLLYTFFEANSPDKYIS